MTENVFIVVTRNGMTFLAETKTKHLLPVASSKAMCILLNYVLRNGDIPNTDTNHWWENEEFKEYLRHETVGDSND